MSDYRKRIYDNYVTGFRARERRFDPTAAHRWAKPYEHYFRGWLPANRDARIVDLACGDGQLLFHLKARGYHHLTGVDISAEQVALAREWGPDVVQDDVFRFLATAPDNSCHVIMALDLIEHLTKDEALNFLEGCSSKLVAGGRVILQTPNADSPMGGAIRYADLTHETSYTPHLLSRLLAMHGFADIDAREMGPIPSGHSLTSSIRFVGWQALRAGLMAWNVLETGAGGSGVLTRVFCISGTKPL